MVFKLQIFIGSLFEVSSTEGYMSYKETCCYTSILFYWS